MLAKSAYHVLELIINVHTAHTLDVSVIGFISVYLTHCEQTASSLITMMRYIGTLYSIEEKEDFEPF